MANLLPGVWSTRTPQKLRNRQVESLLVGWAEPWAALGEVFGLADERPALDRCWRAPASDHAHDSICGCSIDPVHARMEARYDDAEGLAHETIRRALERLAGLGDDPRRAVVRRTGRRGVQPVAPAKHGRGEDPPRRLPRHGHGGRGAGHPSSTSRPPGQGWFTVDGAPARAVASEDQRRVRWMPGQQPLDLEVVVDDVPVLAGGASGSG